MESALPMGTPRQPIRANPMPKHVWKEPCPWAHHGREFETCMIQCLIHGHTTATVAENALSLGTPRQPIRANTVQKHVCQSNFTMDTQRKQIRANPMVGIESTLYEKQGTILSVCGKPNAWQIDKLNGDGSRPEGGKDSTVLKAEDKQSKSVEVQTNYRRHL
ncbi:hypothetical protein CHS0354_009739 [Potamilus streckersoni]|uniref:Uncharacterized protein n=1 Tax=Potamilus streckersoni TaxID=2493646 RepID=A0AAE0VLB6_9BIVA|nr:hypothetical protein CHS0354_009739 [Potamilus streckersoni]